MFSQSSANSGTLTIFTDTSESFFVYLNGSLQNSQPQTSVRIEDLSQPYYSIKVEFTNKFLKGLVKNNVSVMSMDDGTFQESTYKININARKNKSSLTYFSGNPLFTRSNELYVGKAEKSSDINVNADVNININTTVNSPRAVGNNSDYTIGRPKKVREMDFKEFNNAYQSIKNENFDDEKLIMAHTILMNNFLNTNQIARLTPLFTFGKNQLEFVKNAYSRCVDVKNYFLIKDSITFISDKKDFMRFLNNQ